MGLRSIGGVAEAAEGAWAEGIGHPRWPSPRPAQPAANIQVQSHRTAHHRGLSGSSGAPHRSRIQPRDLRVLDVDALPPVGRKQDPDLMELLTPSPLRADALPKLKTLVIPGPSSKHGDAIGKMIAMRWEHTAPLGACSRHWTKSHGDAESAGEGGAECFYSEVACRTESGVLDHNYGNDEVPFQLDYYPIVSPAYSTSDWVSNAASQLWRL
ncbi:hypothetical protein B0H14DRAFT_2630656 [Mycena olivaceomarginata]|nr:hypothetical protein B0H14DRAFT_2630656 [Mycena olivaceomarginata]